MSVTFGDHLCTLQDLVVSTAVCRKIGFGRIQIFQKNKIVDRVTSLYAALERM